MEKVGFLAGKQIEMYVPAPAALVFVPQVCCSYSEVQQLAVPALRSTELVTAERSRSVVG